MIKVKGDSMFDKEKLLKENVCVKCETEGQLINFIDWYAKEFKRTTHNVFWKKRTAYFNIINEILYENTLEYHTNNNYTVLKYKDVLLKDEKADFKVVCEMCDKCLHKDVCTQSGNLRNETGGCNHWISKGFKHNLYKKIGALESDIFCLEHDLKKLIELVKRLV